MAEAGLELPALVERALARDEVAARALVERVYPLVMKIVRAHRPRRLDEEDLAQMVFARVFGRLDQFSGGAPFEHWVSRVAVNTCRNALRSEQRRPEVRRADLTEEEEALVENLAVTQPGEGPDQQAAARDLAGRLLETLEPPDRLLLTWLDLEGRSVKEIHRRTGWGTSRIKVRAFRARRRLRRQLARIAEVTPS